MWKLVQRKKKYNWKVRKTELCPNSQFHTIFIFKAEFWLVHCINGLEKNTGPDIVYLFNLVSYIYIYNVDFIETKILHHFIILP